MEGSAQYVAITVEDILNCDISMIWKGINVYIFNPHLVNKRVAGASVESMKLIDTNDIWKQYEEKISEGLMRLNGDSNSLTENLPGSTELTNAQYLMLLEDLDGKVTNDRYLTLRTKHLYKNNKKHKKELILLKISSIGCIANFYCVDQSDALVWNWQIDINKKDSNCFQMKVSISFGGEDVKLWLKNIVLSKLIKWMHTKTEGIKSLSAISADEYNILYNDLKEKYAKKIIEIWNESTDPLKFVYEDIAIASYLLLLWKQERGNTGKTELQSFADLGCGNGLLVYILSEEGHPGMGVDVRRRKIWDCFPKTVELTEKILNPAEDNQLFSNIDWIIGNHSDELSPWIPVIAARSSFNCNFFLLPCCAYEFNGSKYQRRNAKISQYLDFVEYLKEITEKCKIAYSTDRLKIPSTKRICLIGMERSVTEEQYNSVVLNEIQNYIVERCSSRKIGDSISSEIKTRDPIEKVRNCTKVDKTVVEQILEIIFKKLLSIKTNCSEYPRWNLGGELKMNEVVSVIPRHLLLAIKSECGGIQTLLRNNHELFVTEKGVVRLRKPEPISMKRIKFNDAKSLSNAKFKSRECKFQIYHPEGCPLDDNECSFKHEKVV